MERKRHGRARELCKDLLIILLSLTAVYLILRTQLYSDLSGVRSGSMLAGFLDLLGKGKGSVSPGVDESQPVEVRPMRIAVNLEGMGRYGVQYDQAETDRVFGTVFSLLGEALGSAAEPVRVDESLWRGALTGQSGVYFDFQGAVPLRALYDWLENGGENSALPEADVRRVLLAEDGQGIVTLYYCNEQDGMYYACGTSEVKKGHLRETLSAYSSNSATFAFENPGENSDLLAPYVMLGTAAPTANVYRVSNSVTDELMGQSRENLLTALGFHPQSNTPFRSGTKLLVREGNDDLTVDDGGQAIYHSTSREDPKYPVGGTRTDMVEATQRLAEKSVGAAAWCGEARLYLQGIEETESGVFQIDYGFSLNGAAVQLGGEGYAARFTVKEGRISDFYLNFRSYTASGEQTTLLPEVQAAAAMAALGVDGGELTMAYLDSGSGDTLKAEWIAIVD